MVQLGIDGSTGEGVEKIVTHGLSLLLCMSNECLRRDSKVEPLFSLDQGKEKRCRVKLNFSLSPKNCNGTLYQDKWNLRNKG